MERMEKLIELLNEYEKKGRKSEYYEWEKGIGLPNNLFRRDTRDEEGSHLYSDTADTYVISKKYGFIKWLVENDKIDRKKLEIRPFSDGLVYSDSDCTVYRSDTTYEMLLMLLSISDTPIDLLCSILK